MNLIESIDQPYARAAEPIADTPLTMPIAKAVHLDEASEETPTGIGNEEYVSRTSLGNYRFFRHRLGENRTVTPVTKLAPN